MFIALHQFVVKCSQISLFSAVSDWTTCRLMFLGSSRQVPCTGTICAMQESSRQTKLASPHKAAFRMEN